VNQQRANVKDVPGDSASVPDPGVFVCKTCNQAAVLRDLLLVIWWAFILWLLVTGKKESSRSDSQSPQRDSRAGKKRRGECYEMKLSLS